jgi:hypothetical protein
MRRDSRPKLGGWGSMILSAVNLSAFHAVPKFLAHFIE